MHGNRIHHFPIGDVRRDRGPQVYGAGPAAVLAESVPTECGCRGAWHLSEFVMGTFTAALVSVNDEGAMRFGWWASVSHSQACKKATA